MKRRQFLKGAVKGMAGILAVQVAPAYVGAKILMPVKELILPSTQIITAMEWTSDFSVWANGGNYLYSATLSDSLREALEDGSVFTKEEWVDD